MEDSIDSGFDLKDKSPEVESGSWVVKCTHTAILAHFAEENTIVDNSHQP
jgi:hypothetical protein